MNRIVMKSTEVLSDFYNWFKNYQNNRDNNSTPNCEASLIIGERNYDVSVMVVKSSDNYSTLFIATPGRKKDEELKGFSVLTSNDSNCAFTFQTDSDPAKSFLKICKGSKEIVIMRPC